MLYSWLHLIALIVYLGAVVGFWLMLLPSVALLMATLGVIAAIGPVRQGLRIQPIEALRDE